MQFWIIQSNLLFVFCLTLTINQKKKLIRKARTRFTYIMLNVEKLFMQVIKIKRIQIISIATHQRLETVHRKWWFS